MIIYLVVSSKYKTGAVNTLAKTWFNKVSTGDK